MRSSPMPSKSRVLARLIRSRHRLRRLSGCGVLALNDLGAGRVVGRPSGVGSSEETEPFQPPYAGQQELSPTCIRWREPAANPGEESCQPPGARAPDFMEILLELRQPLVASFSSDSVSARDRSASSIHSCFSSSCASSFSSRHTLTPQWDSSLDSIAPNGQIIGDGAGPIPEGIALQP